MIQIKIEMSNFHQLRPSYSLQALPSYAQPTQLQSPGFEPVSSLQRLPPSPRQVPVAPEQGHYSLSFRKSAELPPKLNNEIADSQPPLAFNTHSPHKARLKKSFRPSSRAGDSSARKNEAHSRGKLEDFSRTTSTFMLTTPQKADRQSAFFEQPPMQFEQKGQIFQNSNGAARWGPQTKENDWGRHTEELLKEIDSLRRTVESFQRQILRLNQEVEESKEGRGKTEKLEKELISLNQHNCYLQSQCMHYLQSCEEKAQALKQAERLLEGLEERNLALQEQLQVLRQREEQLRSEQQKNLSCRSSELEREKLRLFRDKEMEVEGLVRQREEMRKECQWKLKEKEQEVNRLIRSIQAQSSKIAEQEHSRQVDRSQISLLQMKIDNLTSSNQQLTRNVSLYQDQWNALKEEAQIDKHLLEERVKDLTGEADELERSLRAACQEKCKVELYLESSLTSISAQLAISTAERTRLQEEAAETKELLQRKSAQLLKQEEELHGLTKQLRLHQQQLQRMREAETAGNRRRSSIEAQLMQQEENLQKLAEQLLEQGKEKQMIAGELQAERLNILKLQETNRESRNKLMEERHCFQEIKYQFEENKFKQQQLQAKESELLSLLEAQKSSHQSEVSKLEVQLKSLEKQKTEDWRYSEMVRDGLEQRIMQLELNLKKSLLEKETHDIGTETEGDRHSSEDGPESEENYIWVDLEGLQYLCFLLECQPGEEGLLNTIIQKVLSLLADFQQLKYSAQHYRNLLRMFEIEDGPHSGEKMLQEINDLRESASILLFRMKELEERQEGTESELLRLRSGRNDLKTREKQVQEREKEGREQVKKMRELNGQLTEEMLRLRARISNSRMNTRSVLDLIRETV